MGTLKICPYKLLFKVLITMTILLCCSIQAHADQYGDYTYTVTNRAAQITHYTGLGGNLLIPSTLGGYAVTSIGDGAFSGCQTLNSVSLPQGVTSLGNNAFYDCENLTSVTIPGVTNIGSAAFYNCQHLTSISIPDGVTSIKDQTFYGCTYLSDISLPSTLKSIGTEAFTFCLNLNSVLIPDGVISIGDKAYEGCILTNISIPASVTSIGSRTLRNCSYLTSIDVADNNLFYSSIDGVLFNKSGSTLIKCPEGVTSISIPQSVTSIGDYAFELCHNLTSISIPQGVTSIGEAAFSWCDYLTNIDMPEGLTIIGPSAFLYCESLTNISIPQGVTRISNEAFYGCKYLISVSIPESVTSIGDYAFAWCSCLKNVIIPQGVVNIGPYAFNACESLSSITFNSATTSIYDDAGTIDYSAKIIGYDSSTAENYALKYGRIFEVIPTTPVALQSIEITNPANKLVYTVGESLDITGLVVIGTYIDGSTKIENIDISNVTGFNSSEAATDQILTINLNGLTATYTVQILPQTVDPDGDYSYIVTGGEAQIIEYKGQAENLTIPDVLGGAQVTSIGDYAFNGNLTLTSVTIPKSVTYISNIAFLDCSALTSIQIADGNLSYQSIEGVLYNKQGTVLITCPRGLTNISIPQGVISIGDYAFDYCKYLTSINIPQGVFDIGEWAFDGCQSLTSLNIPEGVAVIRNGTFSDCKNLSSISFPQGITSIGEYAFANCISLTKMSIPKGVLSIGECAFSGCQGLTSISIPQGTATIGGSAFQNCDNITSIILPDSVTSIGQSAYYLCGSLSDITFYSKTTSIFDYETTIPVETTIVGYDPSTAKDYALKYGRLFNTISANLESIAITTMPTKLEYAVGETIDLTGLVVTGTYSDGSKRGEVVAADNISGFDSTHLNGDQVITITIGGKTATFTVSISCVELKNEPLQITIPSDVTDAFLTTNAENGVVTIPEVSVQSSTSIGVVQVNVPDGTQITGPQDWDGKISLPQVIDNDSIPVELENGNTANISAAIEVGLPDITLTFDKPVRIMISGQGGKNAGWIRQSNFTPITYLMTADSSEALGNNVDGYITDGDNLVIWTTHFTTFVAYTETTKVNSDPVVNQVISTLTPVKVGTSVVADANFTDIGDTHTASWSWGDGSTSEGIVTELNGSGTVRGTHNYSKPGIYTVGVTVTDAEGKSDSSMCQEYVVIYDPNGGFVTGAGWINSPVGAYVNDSTLSGKANFGFVSKYQKGANIPTGQTEFQFKAGNLNFHSSGYEWMVIAGGKAQYKGTGTINGEGNYRFILSVIDGQSNGDKGLDKFRIKIWGDNGIVYDNQLNSNDTDDPTTTIGGGSIVIQKN